MRTLTPLDLEVLEALATPPGTPRTAGGLAEQLEVALFQVQGSLRAMRRGRLVTMRDGSDPAWSITELGHGELGDRASIPVVGNERTVR